MRQMLMFVLLLVPTACVRPEVATSQPAATRPAVAVTHPCYKSGEPIPIDSDMALPRLISRVSPKLDGCRPLKDEDVTLAAEIGPSGVPQNCRVVKGATPCLDAASLAAFRQWRYCAAEKSGKFVTLTLNVTIHFKPRAG